MKLKRCFQCRKPYMARAATKVCSPECYRKWHQRVWRRYYKRKRAQLLVYYREYHLKNRERRIARQREYMRRYNASLTPEQKAKRRERAKKYERERRLIEKVSKQWGVGWAEARAMIATNNFPP